MKPRQAILLGIYITAGIAFSADRASLNKQGVEAFNAGDYRKAIACFTDALKLSPGDQATANNLTAACRSLAAEYAGRGDYANAVQVLREGLSLMPQSSLLRGDLITASLNHGIACYNTRDYVRGRQVIAEVLQLDNGNPAANRLAGDIAYAQHDLAAARTHWQRVLAADPANTVVADRLKRLQKEQGVERTYSKMEAYHFDIRFDYRTLGNGVIDLRAFLMEAYEKVGRDFERFPEYPITVILYGENEFREINNVPGWVAGLYDGKIRIPIDFSRIPLATLKGIIFHEYTHALIYDLCGAACPVWLNEGIAMREMNAPGLVAIDVLRKALSSGTTIPFDRLNDLTGVWRNAGIAPLAYAQSWIMAEYLFNRWSNNQVKNVLLRFKQGVSFGTVLREAMNRTPAQFEEEWKAYARGRL
ncbi:MAG: tetratricopeptide repeat protein [Chitinispirillaceae bacterium]|nr:tetratricopeptide repeat protein [Chitinispirillaceae bacterium]